MNKQEREELNALIEHEEKNILFYALYYEMFLEKGMPVGELVERINFHLDRLIPLYKQRIQG